MKTGTNVSISLLLAFIITAFVRNISSKNNISGMLKKTQLTRQDGTTFDKKVLKNKVVIVSFFQTWCSDCVKEQPDLLKLKEKFGNKVEILMISDEPMDLMLKFKNQFQSPLNFYNSSKRLKTDLGVKGFPTTYLFDKKGEEQLMKVEGINWYTPEIVAMIEQM